MPGDDVSFHQLKNMNILLIKRLDYHLSHIYHYLRLDLVLDSFLAHFVAWIESCSVS